jgi:arylsulfatase A-like enzyme
MKRPLRRPTVLMAGLLLFAVLYPSACSKAKEDSVVIRIIDRIGAKNVVASPFKAPDPKNDSLMEVAGKFGMNELGTGENPFGIKMKLHVGPSDVNALAAAPPTTIAFDLKVPRDARLELLYGIRCDDVILKAKGGARTVDFAVVLSTSGSEQTFFQEKVRLGPGRVLAFRGRTVDLSPFAGRDVSIRFVTKGDDRALAFWFSPVIYAVRRDPRYVILISLDTLRADHLACYGYDRDTSPNIDLLARDGVRFAESRAASAWTLPSHISMLTAQNTFNHGVCAPDLRLDPATPTLAELLKAKGYWNAAFTGGGYVSGFFGFNKGFDSFRIVGEKNDRDGAAKLARSAERWIQKNLDRNFFLFLHTYQIHNPYNADEPWNRRYLREGAELSEVNMVPLGFFNEKRFRPVSEDFRRNIIGLYDGEIRYTDENLIGPLVAKLKALGIYDRTMIVLTSDHGDEFFEHGSWLHTHSVYDEVIRVPLIVKFFASRNAGRTVRASAFGVDVMPTIAEELGIKVPSGGIDGRSLLPLADGGDEASGNSAPLGLSEVASRAMSIHIPLKVALVRSPFKFIINEPYSREDLAYFLSPPPPLAAVELFDISNDPGETRNLAAERPELARELRNLLRERYKPRKKPGAEKVEMGDDLIKQLKTLGYL